MPRLCDRKKEMVEELMKEAIYSASMQVLDQGWSGFTMDRVAEQAGVSKGTVYNYFTDKSELILYIADQLAKEEEQRIAAVMEKYQSCSASFEEILRTELKQRQTQANIITSMIHAFHQDARLRELVLKDSLPLVRIRNHWSTLLKAGIKSGEFASYDNDVMAVVLTSILIGCSRQWAEEELYSPSSVVADNIMKVLRNGLFSREEIVDETY